MSYILEALKKAQAERARGTVPNVNAQPLAPSAPGLQKRRATLVLGAAALAAVCAALALAWIAPWQRERIDSAPLAAAAPTPAAPAPRIELRAESEMPAQPAAVPPAPKPAPPALKPAAPAPSAAPEPAPERPEPVALLQDLPPQIQREIPTLAINGYIYASNPAQRSVLINNRLRREGDQVAPGLTLEKLLPKEMLLNYRGYRYRIAY
jgi:general secretion pathway protein B